MSSLIWARKTSLHRIFSISLFGDSVKGAAGDTDALLPCPAVSSLICPEEAPCLAIFGKNRCCRPRIFSICLLEGAAATKHGCFTSISCRV